MQYSDQTLIINYCVCVVISKNFNTAIEPKLVFVALFENIHLKEPHNCYWPLALLKEL